MQTPSGQRKHFFSWQNGVCLLYIIELTLTQLHLFNKFVIVYAYKLITTLIRYDFSASHPISWTLLHFYVTLR